MTDPSSPSLRIEGAVATITLCRPQQHNRIDPDDPGVILKHLEAAAREPRLSALVITGSGHDTFSAGYTLGQLGSRLDRSFEDMLDCIERFELPTLCAMNGSAYGGGTDLAMSCDFRIGVHGSRLFMPAAKFGLHYYPGGLRRFVTRLGPAATKKIFLTARTMEAEELLRLGFPTDLVDRDVLDATVQSYLRSLQDCEPAAVKSMKQHIDQLALGSWSEAAGRVAYENSLRSPATVERLAALGQGRPR